MAYDEKVVRVRNWFTGVPVPTFGLESYPETVVPTQVVQEAMEEAMSLTGLPPCKTLPQVTVEHPMAVLLETGRANILGAYTWKDHKVILVQPWSWEDISNRCTLVHEMVHALQRDFLGLNDVDSTLAMKAERQAYAAQFTWLHTHGKDELETLPPLAVHMLERETGLPWSTMEDRRNAMSYATVPPV